MDRQLPFDFGIFQALGRTICIAVYLSRHPSTIEGESVKAAELWNNWFTVNHVHNVNSVLADDFSGPIRGRQWIELNRNDERNKSSQTETSCEQTKHEAKSNKMGQSN